MAQEGAMTNLLNLGLSADKTQATVTPAQAIPTANSQQIEQAIFELATLRNSMLPEVQPDPPESSSWRVVANARVQLHPELGDAAILLVRNTGFGWHYYRLESPQLEELQTSIE